MVTMKCSKCGYDNSLHDESKCAYCGSSISPSKIINGFHMDIIPSKIGNYINNYSCQAYIKGDFIILKIGGINNKNEREQVLNNIKFSYDSAIEERRCSTCGSLFCDNMECDR